MRAPIYWYTKCSTFKYVCGVLPMPAAPYLRSGSLHKINVTSLLIWIIGQLAGIVGNFKSDEIVLIRRIGSPADRFRIVKSIVAHCAKIYPVLLLVDADQARSALWSQHVNDLREDSMSMHALGLLQAFLLGDQLLGNSG